jgi:hypothetical protein
MFTTLFDYVPGLQWDERRGIPCQTVKGGRSMRMEPGLHAGSRFQTPEHTPDKRKREDRTWTAGTVSTRVPSSRGGTPAARSMMSSFSEDERSEERTPIVAELDRTMAVTQPILRHSGSAPSLTMKSTAVSLERALVEIHRLTGTPMHRTRAGVPMELANSAAIGGVWTPRGKPTSPWGSWDEMESTPTYLDSFLPTAGRPGTSPLGAGDGSSLDGLVSPLAAGEAGEDPFPMPPEAELLDDALAGGGEPDAEAPPAAPEPVTAEAADAEPAADDSAAAPKAVKTMTQEEVEAMKKRMSDLGIGAESRTQEKSSIVNRQFTSYGFEEDEDAKLTFVHRGLTKMHTAKIAAVEKPVASYNDDEYKSLLQYWLGEDVDPELFPEYPENAERSGNWYVSTITGKELSLAHVFSQEHCEKTGRPWEEFNKHNPLRHIAARGSTEKGPWRRTYAKARRDTKKDRALCVREVYDREEWFKVALGFANPMSCGGIRNAKPSRHIRWGEWGLNANPHLKYSGGKIV